MLAIVEKQPVGGVDLSEFLGVGRLRALEVRMASLAQVAISVFELLHAGLLAEAQKPPSLINLGKTNGHSPHGTYPLFRWAASRLEEGDSLSSKGKSSEKWLRWCSASSSLFR